MSAFATFITLLEVISLFSFIFCFIFVLIGSVISDAFSYGKYLMTTGICLLGVSALTYMTYQVASIFLI